ncbi:hypothetical protein ACFQJ8_08620 [Halocatena marina]|uniref:hypothetical protein n=1 Tax=Halocatena marina TaxID=2934937 RepID=UPI00360AAC76
MTESATTDDSSLLDLSPAERDEYGITAADVQEELLDVIVHDSAGKTVFVDCTLPGSISTTKLLTVKANTLLFFETARLRTESAPFMPISSSRSASRSVQSVMRHSIEHASSTI